jgi:hypothetical protein
VEKEVMPQRRRGVECDECDQRPGEIGMGARQNVLDRRLVMQRRKDRQMRPGDDSIKHGRDIEHGGRDQRPAGERQNEQRGVKQQMGCFRRLALGWRH